MSIEARQIQETLYSYAAILNFTPSPQGLRAKFGACSVQNAQLLGRTQIYEYVDIVRLVTRLFQQDRFGLDIYENIFRVFFRVIETKCFLFPLLNSLLKTKKHKQIEFNNIQFKHQFKFICSCKK